MNSLFVYLLFVVRLEHENREMRIATFPTDDNNEASVRFLFWKLLESFWVSWIFRFPVPQMRIYFNRLHLTKLFRVYRRMCTIHWFADLFFLPFSVAQRKLSHNSTQSGVFAFQFFNWAFSDLNKRWTATITTTVMMLRLEMQWLIWILFVSLSLCSFERRAFSARSLVHHLLPVCHAKRMRIKQLNDQNYTFSLAQIPYRNHFNGNWKWLVRSALSSMGSYGDLSWKAEYLSPISILSLWFLFVRMLLLHDVKVVQKFRWRLIKSQLQTNSSDNQALAYFIHVFDYQCVQNSSVQRYYKSYGNAHAFTGAVHAVAISKLNQWRSHIWCARFPLN